MAKAIPTEAFVTFDSVVYYMIDIVANFTVEKGDATDGNTGGDGREYLAGRVDRELTGKLFIDGAVAEPVEGAAGSLTLTALDGTTDKAWAWTNATIFNKSLNINAAGTDPMFATYTFNLDGATTPTQLT